MQIGSILTVSKSRVSGGVNLKYIARYQHRDDVYPGYVSINQKELFWSKFYGKAAVHSISNDIEHS